MMREAAVRSHAVSEAALLETASPRPSEGSKAADDVPGDDPYFAFSPPSPEERQRRTYVTLHLLAYRAAGPCVWRFCSSGGVLKCLLQAGDSAARGRAPCRRRSAAARSR